VYRFFENSDFTAELSHSLDQFQDEAGNAWAFSKASKREAQHSLIQYPAMMVPPMQRRLLQAVDEASPGRKRLLDPFMGSGTMLTEALFGGHFFVGRDINPLAVLSCQVKSTFYDRMYLESRADHLLKRVEGDKGRSFAVKFPNYQKWFSRSAMLKLSRIYRAIEQEIDQDTRRFFWLALAETVRLSSNSRTTTYKLHIRPKHELEHDERDVLKIFRIKLKLSISAMSEIQEINRIHVASGTSESLPKRTPDVDIQWGNSADVESLRSVEPVDLIFTSPPYGDNVTTVPYGQFSYLPLQWIPIDDISPGLPSKLLASTLAIDSSSLGGSKKLASEKAEILASKSESFKNLYEDLHKLEGDYSKRVAAFSFDLISSFSIFSSKLKNKGLIFATVGNRSVGGHVVRLDSIISESVLSNGLVLLGEIEREIPRKRMPNRNSISATMNKEKVLIFEKRG